VTSAPELDACPGLLTLHPARDGHVARIRLPGGYVSGPRWRALAALADRFGDGCLDLTARGNIQLRGLREADAAPLAARAAAAGLLPSAAHDRARNITASPLAGLAGRAPLRRLVARLDAVLLADAGLAALPGRFLFALDDGADQSGGNWARGDRARGGWSGGCAGLARCDVGLRRSGDRVEVIVAGRRAGVTVPVPAAVPAAVAAARAAVACGVGSSVTRVADLADGGASVAAAIGGALGAPLATTEARLPLGPVAAGPGHPADFSETMVLGAPLARLTGGQARLIAEWLRPREVVRLGIAGRLVLPLVSAGPGGQDDSSGPAAGQPADRAARQLAEAGLLVRDDDPRAGVTACSGAACRRSAADVRAVAAPVPGHARTHWAGCARQCGCPPDAEPVIAVAADLFRFAGQCDQGGQGEWGDQGEPVMLAALTG
jgi:precorrin-3B synthase